VASVCQPSTLRMLIWPEASSAQNNIAAVSAEGSTVCVLMRRLNSSCRRSIALVVRTLFHWSGGRRVQVKSFRRPPPSVGDGAVLEPPFADERFAARLDLFARLGVDHVVVVGTDLLMQPLERMRQEVAMFVNRAAQHGDIGAALCLHVG
jgi:hypothetical protein